MTSTDLKHPELHWWLSGALGDQLRIETQNGIVLRPAGVSVMKPKVADKPYNQAMKEMQEGRVLVAFDVWWANDKKKTSKQNNKAVAAVADALKNNSTQGIQEGKTRDAADDKKKNEQKIQEEKTAAAPGAPTTRKKANITKGFVVVPGNYQWFYDHVQQPLPVALRTFYQVIDPKQSCAWYFDVDEDSPEYDMIDFLQTIFEEMASMLPASLGKTADHLWRETLLLDASFNVASMKRKSSCHGICPTLVFADNHTHMKSFALELWNRVEKRTEHNSLDKSVYSSKRCFRMLGNSKMDAGLDASRPLVLAPYNRAPVMANLFQQSLVPQGLPVTVSKTTWTNDKKPQKPVRKNADSKPKLGQRHLEPKKRRLEEQVQETQERRPNETEAKRPKAVAVGGTSDLEALLLKQLQSWGNRHPSVNCIQPCKHRPETRLYVGFAGATSAQDHQHESNNLYAMVDLSSLTITWHCHQGSQQPCPSHRQELPFNVAMQISFAQE
jgi:hypothetical protein